MATNLVRLSSEEIQEGLKTLEQWNLVGDEIARTFTFATYKDGLVFASVVGHLADRADHHPTIVIGYQKVTVSLNTHDVSGISVKDFDLAQQINDLS